MTAAGWSLVLSFAALLGVPTFILFGALFMLVKPLPPREDGRLQ